VEGSCEHGNVSSVCVSSGKCVGNGAVITGMFGGEKNL
jgi:hypothetical protein